MKKVIEIVMDLELKCRFIATYNNSEPGITIRVHPEDRQIFAKFANPESVLLKALKTATQSLFDGPADFYLEDTE